MKTVRIKVIDKTRAPEDIKNLSTKKIGSVYTKTGDVLRGLTLEEEVFYLPTVLGVAANDPAFGRATRMFWADISIVLDAEAGDYELNIDGEWKDFEDSNGNKIKRFVPENITDWLHYKFIQKHPRVAHKKEDIIGADGSVTVNDKKYMYYIENPEDIKKKDEEILDLNLKADKLFLQLFQEAKGEENKDKISWVVDMYKGEVDADDPTDTRTLVDPKSIQNFLYNKKRKNPTKFISIVSDELLEEKSFITRCISDGLLQRIGNTIVDDQQPIGESLKEAAIYLKNPKNSKIYLSLKERLKTFA